VSDLSELPRSFDEWPSSDGLRNYVHAVPGSWDRPPSPDHDFAVEAVHMDVCWRLTQGLDRFASCDPAHWATQRGDPPIAHAGWIYDTDPRDWGSDPDRLDRGLTRLPSRGWLGRRDTPANLYRLDNIHDLARRSDGYPPRVCVFALRPGSESELIEALNAKEPPAPASLLSEDELIVVIGFGGEVPHAPCMGIRCRHPLAETGSAALVRDLAIADRHVRANPGAADREALVNELS